MRWLLSTTQLMGIRCVSLFRFGIDELIDVSADPAGFVVARQNLDGVSPRQQRVARVVLDVALDQLGRGLAAELDLHLVADVLHRGPVLIFDFADEIDDASAPRRPRRASASSLPGIFITTGT